jgi:hypothetical protein
MTEVLFTLFVPTLGRDLTNYNILPYTKMYINHRGYAD